MASKKRKTPGPIVPLQAYERLAYECRRCDVLFISPSGPEPFCEQCRATLEAAALAPRPDSGGTP